LGERARLPQHLLNERTAQHFTSKDDAVSALSDNLILWAKSQPHPARITTSSVSVDMTYPSADFTPMFPTG
jgi:hypothetical protein